MSNETLTLDRPPDVASAAELIPGMFVKKGVDLYMRDHPDDPGADVFKDHETKSFWNSPDLWVRHKDDGITTHQNPVAGKTNWFYATIRNRGTKPATLFFVNFKLTQFLGTQFVYPGDFLTDPETFVVNLTASPLDPGKSRMVKLPMKAAAGGHACWLASVLTEGDWPKLGINVWDSNNLAQKNLTVIDAAPGDIVRVPFRAGSQFMEHAEMFRMEILRSRKWTQMAATLVHPEARKVESVFKVTGASAAFMKKDADLSVDTKGSLHLAYHHGLRAGFPVNLPARTPLDLGLDITVPKDARAGEVIETHLVQRNREDKVVGGFTVQVNVAAKH